MDPPGRRNSGQIGIGATGAERLFAFPDLHILILVPIARIKPVFWSTIELDVLCGHDMQGRYIAGPGLTRQARFISSTSCQPCSVNGSATVTC